MLTLALAAFLATPVPTASQALLAERSASEITALLIAQAPDRADEEKNLESDMDRAREHLGHAPANGDGGQPTLAPAPLPPEPDEQPTPRRKHRHERGPRQSHPQLLSEDGHAKPYYLAWGIVDWNIAASLWAIAAYLTAAAAIASTVADKPGYCGDFADSPSCDRNPVTRRDAGGLFVAALAFGAGGGIVAWRAGTNIGAFKDLREQEHAQFDRYR